MESIWALIVKMAVISPAVVWLFYILASYRDSDGLDYCRDSPVGYSYFTSHTVMGRHLYALEATKSSEALRCKTKRLLFLAYVNMAFGSRGGHCLCRQADGSPQAGQSFELDAIGACFLGGASATAVGTVGTLIGALFMGVLNNGMSIMGIAPTCSRLSKVWSSLLL